MPEPETTYVLALTNTEVKELVALKDHLLGCMFEESIQRRGLCVLICVLGEIQSGKFKLD